MKIRLFIMLTNTLHIKQLHVIITTFFCFNEYNKKSSPIGVLSHGGLIGVLSKTSARLRPHLFFDWSEEGVAFAREKKEVTFRKKDNTFENISNCSNFRFYTEQKTAYATYFRQEKTEKNFKKYSSCLFLGKFL